MIEQYRQIRTVIGCCLPILMLCCTTEAADWPQWRGINRDGISAERGLRASWPTAGPPILWKIKGVGEGWSSVAIANNRIYTQGQRDDNQYLFAFDKNTGNKLWETPITKRYDREGADEGPRGTPTVRDGLVYAMAVDGVLACLDAVNGKVIWSLNVVEKYGGSTINWGISESPLVDGDRVIVTPGGPGATVVSLNRFNGELQWKTSSDGAAYSSAIVADVGGIRQVLVLTAKAVISIKIDSGELLWSYNKVSEHTINIPTPIYHDSHVFVSTRDGGCALLKLAPRTMSEVYFNRDMKNQYSTSVLVGEVLYGYSGSILTAMEFKTGKVLWRERSTAPGSIIYADNHLYILSEDGVVSLVRATRDKYDEISRFEVDIGKRPSFCPFFALPAISDGKLYVRIKDNIICYNVKA
jgi:outer membrane protein assembly factor BamB